MHGEGVTAISVEVAATAGGATEQEVALTVRISLASERISVRELLERTVAAQWHELLQGQRLGDEAAAQILARQYLTHAEIEQQAAKGSVRFGAAAGAVRVDLKCEVQRALRGFEKRTFRVVVNGEMFKGLDDELYLTPATKITCLRLAPLKGG
ncbi:MAG: hypothetical protein H7Z43_07560 [Clostridia bacterium]|nr:hypothetical protein [Deltaproteobacteria bacterium]